jgi:hypothetical protein
VRRSYNARTRDDIPGEAEGGGVQSALDPENRFCGWKIAFEAGKSFLRVFAGFFRLFGAPNPLEFVF